MVEHVWLIRHGETPWSAHGRHTGRSDIPLTARGREQAKALLEPLTAVRQRAAQVWSSPLSRARETARLSGFEPTTIVAELAEWDYGEFEGRTTADLQQDQPGWSIWTTSIRQGESLTQVGQRADRLIQRLRRCEGEVVAFAHGHLLRILAARWVDLEPVNGRLLTLQTSTVSLLGFDRGSPVIKHWNSPANGGAHVD